MEFSLNVYKTRGLKQVEKTYKVSDFELSFGACEDVLNAINIDLFAGGLDALSDEAKTAEMFKMVVDALPVIKDILKDVFDGLTDDELKRTSVKELVGLVMQVIRYSMATLGKSVPEKN